MCIEDNKNETPKNIKKNKTKGRKKTIECWVKENKRNAGSLHIFTHFSPFSACSYTVIAKTRWI